MFEKFMLVISLNKILNVYEILLRQTNKLLGGMCTLGYVSCKSGLLVFFLQIIHTDLSSPFQQIFQTEDQVEILPNASDLSWV